MQRSPDGRLLEFHRMIQRMQRLADADLLAADSMAKRAIGPAMGLFVLFVYLLDLSMYMSIFTSVYLSIWFFFLDYLSSQPIPSTCPSIQSTVYLCIYLSVYLSVYLFSYPVDLRIYRILPCLPVFIFSYPILPLSKLSVSLSI